MFFDDSKDIAEEIKKLMLRKSLSYPPEAPEEKKIYIPNSFKVKWLEIVSKK